MLFIIPTSAESVFSQERIVFSKAGSRRIILSLVLLCSGIILFVLSNPPWTTPSATIAYYSVLAFLCVTMTASVVTKIRTDPSPTNRWFIAGTSYAAIVFCGAAIYYTFSNESPVAHSTTSGIFLNLVAFAITGISMLIFSYIERYEIKKTSILYHRMIIPLVVTIGSSVFIIMLIATRLVTDQSIFLIAGYTVGTIAVVSYLAAGYLMYTLRNSGLVHDTFRLALAFWLLAVASVNHIILLPNPSSMWIVSISLMALSFLYANVATSYTFLLNVGVRKNLAYGVTIFLSALVLVPFIASRLISIIFPTTIFIELGAKVIINLAAAILAGASAYAFHVKIRYRPSPGQQWVILLLLYWMIAEISLMFSQILPGYSVGSESLVPYICGSIVSAIVLPMAVKRTLNPKQIEKGQLNPVYAIGLIASILMITVSEFLRGQLLLIFDIAIVNAVGTAIMLSLSYVSLFVILTYVLLVTSESGGRISFNSLGSGLVAVWLVITILKANYATWTIGWWSAEVIMILSIIIFTLITVRMFLIDTIRAEKREKRAIAFSRFLSEIISTHQTAAINSLSDISMDSTTGDTTLRSVSTAMSEISQANELSKFIGTFITGHKFTEEQMEPVSLKDSIYSALESTGVGSVKDFVKVGAGVQSIELRMEQDCAVLANSFLVDAFQYILEGISKRIGHYESLSINFRDSEDVKFQCICEMNVDVQVEEPDNIVGLFGRYVERSSLDAVELAYSKQIVSLLGGSMSWTVVKSGEKIVSISIIIQLQKAQ